MSKTLPEAFKKIEKVMLTSQRQALARASNSTKARFSQEMTKVGIPSARAKARTKIIRTAQAAILSIGIRVQLAIHDFSPGEKRIMTPAGKRYAATYKIKGKDRAIVGDGAFLATGKGSGKKIILQRVGDARYPTKTVLTDIFEQTVQDVSGTLAEYMGERFAIEYNHAVSYNLDKIINKN